MLIRAAERAASLGANAEAQRSLEHATELMDERLEQAGLHERAGAWRGRADERRKPPHTTSGRSRCSRPRVPRTRRPACPPGSRRSCGTEGGSATLSGGWSGRSRCSRRRNQTATWRRWRQRSRVCSSSPGRRSASAARVEVALEIAEALGLPEILSQALNTKSLTLQARGRQREALALLRYALDVALDHEIPTAALRAYYNLTDAAIQVDSYREATERILSGLALARRVGHRDWELQFVGQMYPQVALGEWDDVLETAEALPPDAIENNRIAYNGFLCSIPSIRVRRGEFDEARASHADLRGCGNVRRPPGAVDRGRGGRDHRSRRRAVRRRPAGRGTGARGAERARHRPRGDQGCVRGGGRGRDLSGPVRRGRGDPVDRGGDPARPAEPVRRRAVPAAARSDRPSSG